MSNNCKKPAIRFQGFTDDWEQRKLGECFEFMQNNTLSRAELQAVRGAAINVHYGDVLIKYGEYLNIALESMSYIPNKAVVDKLKGSLLADGDIIMADTAEDETVGKCSEIAGLQGQAALSGLHTIPLRPKEKFESGFLGYYMNSGAYHDQLLPLMQGIKVTSISKSAVKDTEISYPLDKSEQAAIGRYFIQLDNLITLHQRKYDKIVQVKKSMLEKMFPKNGSNVPEIRFEGFTDAWEQRKLSEVSERVTRKNQDLESELPLTISAQYGLIDQNEFFDKRIASKDVSGYYLVKNGEFAYNKSTSTDAPWGAIKRLDRYEMGVLSTLYIVFRILDEQRTSSDYLVTYYDTNLWHKGVQTIAAEGARNHGLLNISADDFLETTLVLPQDVEEQQLIGSFMKELDNLITLHQRKLEKLKNIKKSMLEKMFV